MSLPCRAFVKGVVISLCFARSCGVENFEMFGQLMISFRPLMHQLPVVGAFQVPCKFSTHSLRFLFLSNSSQAGALVAVALIKQQLTLLKAATGRYCAAQLKDSGRLQLLYASQTIQCVCATGLLCGGAVFRL